MYCLIVQNITIYKIIAWTVLLPIGRRQWPLQILDNEQSYKVRCTKRIRFHIVKLQFENTEDPINKMSLAELQRSGFDQTDYISIFCRLFCKYSVNLPKYVFLTEL